LRLVRADERDASEELAWNSRQIGGENLHINITRYYFLSKNATDEKGPQSY
jgi:hypothetical protein